MRDKGFTLTELMVVLFLAAVGVGITVPSLVDSYRSYALRAAADEFVTRHAVARSAAVWHGRTAELHIDTVEGRFWVEVDTGSVAVQKDTIGPVKHLPLAVSMSVDPAGTDVICFDSRGFPGRAAPCDPPEATVKFFAGDREVTLMNTQLGKLLR